MTKCAYCSRTGKNSESHFLTCSSCNQKVHTGCLKIGCVPGGLLGDTFFYFVCQSCNVEDCEQITRQKMSWKRKKSWMGTVSGTLSHFCPTFFLSGTEMLKEPGWWRLVHSNMTPQDIVSMHAELLANKKKWVSSRVESTEKILQHTSPKVEEKHNSIPDQEVGTASSSCTSEASEYLLASMEDTDDTFPNNIFEEEKNILADMDVDIEDVDSIDFNSERFSDFENLLRPVSSYSAESSCSSFLSILPDITNQTEDHLPQFTSEDTYFNSSFSNNTTIKMENFKEEVPEPGSDEGVNTNADESYGFTDHVIPKSLFVLTPPEFQTPPWKELERKEREYFIQASQSRTVPMSEYEELQLLSQLRQASKNQELPGFARRLYTKLRVRQQKRQRGLPILNLDSLFLSKGTLTSCKSVWVNSKQKVTSSDAPILDRFYHVPLKSNCKTEKQNCSFKIRLMGHSEPTCFFSPYTQRQLKPYIRRDYETTPLWLRLLSEIKIKANKNNPNWRIPQRSPIDYCYVRPQHISTVNSLCCEFFYPGIDLSEALQYPDFSCVVLYKKLIIAFAFMVPDVGYNETYISFLFTRPEWRNAGIATFMLYHLIQTCMGKDITLHVSATNPAVILYQKFGFKIEEFILDFYDKYLPADSHECKHALFLRLSR